MATTNTWSVDPSTTPSPTPDYTTVNAWYAAQGGADISATTGSDEIRVAQCAMTGTPAADGSTLSMSGSTTEAGNYYRIEATGDHNGLWDTSVFHWDRSYNSTIISISDDYTQLYGVQLNNTHNSGEGFIVPSGTLGVLFERVIAKTTGTGTGTYAFYTSGTGSNTTKFINCLAYDWASTIAFRLGGPWSATGSNNPQAINCTAVDCGTGFSSLNGSAECVNCVADGCTDGFSGTFYNSNYNASDIASDAPGANSQNGTATTFNARASDDFTLGSGDTVCKDNGTSTSSYGCTDDVKGTARPQNSVYDIGFHEIVAGGAPTRRVMVVS